MKNLKKATAMLLAVAMLFSMVLAVPAANAAKKAKKPALSPKKISLKVGQTKKVTLKNAAKAKKTKWSAKPKNAVKLSKKAKKSVTVKASRAVKKVTLTAKFKLGKKSKKAKCTISISKNVVPTQAPATAIPLTPATETPSTGTPSTGTPSTGTPSTGTPATEDPATEAPTETPATETPAPGTPGPVIFQESFEDGYGANFRPMGNPTFTTVTGGYANNCLKISGRTAEWNGIDSPLISTIYKYDTDYSFSIWVKHETAEAREIKATLDKGTGETDVRYQTIASNPAVPPNEWTELTGTINFSEADTSSPKFYIECPGTDFADFYVDEFSIRGVTAPVDTSLPPTASPITFSYEGLEDEPMASRLAGLEPTTPMVAFTFDDGPVGGATGTTAIQIQDALDAAGASATFFYQGNKISTSSKAEIARAQDLGFEIGNHTFSHVNLSGSAITPATIIKEVGDTQALLTEVTGYTNFLVRAPFLGVSNSMKAYTQAPYINSQVDSQDYVEGRTKQQVYDSVISSADGSIVLMHEPYTHTAQAVPELLQEFENRGWKVVSVSELYASRETPLRSGVVSGNPYARCAPPS